MKLLYDLLETPSPSGNEINAQKKIINTLKEEKFNVMCEQNGNVTFNNHENSKMKVLLAAHIDEISLIVNKINSNGTLSVSGVGGIRPYMYIGHHVCILNSKKTVNGVIGYVADMAKKDLKASDLVIDIGCNSYEESAKLISVGDYVVHKTTYTNLNNNYLAARALDDKLGVYIILETLKKVKNSQNSVYASATVGEETTGRGAKAISYKINPSVAIAIDVTYANDINYASDLTGDVKLGGGPVLCTGSLLNPIVHQLMIDACNKLNIKYQMEISTSRTFTDVDSMFYQNGSTPTYLISIPLRYMHSSVEVCCMDDVNQIIDLLVEFINSLNENVSFNPFD